MGWAIALHGGAGDIPRTLPPERREPRLATLRRCLDLGAAALRAGRSALDVVELVVRELEDCPHFNAGKGSVLTSDGTVEMEASVMDGTDMRCGAVSGLSTVVNPISLARLVMDKTPHIYLAFEGAEAFARDQGVEVRDQSHFITEENIDRLRNAKEANRVQIDYTQYNYTQPIQAPNDDNSRTGTVGCVAVDVHGRAGEQDGRQDRRHPGHRRRHLRQRPLRRVHHGQGRGHHEAHRGARRGGGDGAPGPPAGGGRRPRRGRRAPGLRGAGGRVGRRGGDHGVQHHGDVQGVRHRGRVLRGCHMACLILINGDWGELALEKYRLIMCVCLVSVVSTAGADLCVPLQELD